MKIRKKVTILLLTLTLCIACGGLTACGIPGTADENLYTEDEMAMDEVIDDPTIDLGDGVSISGMEMAEENNDSTMHHTGPAAQQPGKAH